MSDGIKPFNGEAQLREVLSGFKGGPFYRTPNLAPKMVFKDGYPAELNKSLGMMPGSPKTAAYDPWVQRRPNSSMK